MKKALFFTIPTEKTMNTSTQAMWFPALPSLLPAYTNRFSA
ncbi:MAG: hypothetical protein ABI476_05775 [Oxalobacteraceae bacterium]